MDTNIDYKKVFAFGVLSFLVIMFVLAVTGCNRNVYGDASQEGHLCRHLASIVGGNPNNEKELQVCVDAMIKQKWNEDAAGHGAEYRNYLECLGAAENYSHARQCQKLMSGYGY